MTGSNPLNIKNPQELIDALREDIATRRYNKDILEKMNQILVKLDERLEDQKTTDTCDDNRVFIIAIKNYGKTS